MKSYWSIPGPSKAPAEHCLAFYKYDGSNLRFEWNKKQGWYKFGTRRRLFDQTDAEYGRAIPLFLERYGDGLPKVFRDKYGKRDQIIAFCEFYGDESFAGYHNFEKPMEVTLIDVEIHKQGFVLPREFVDNFSHLPIAPLVYEGKFNSEFVQSVIDNEYGLKEGVVAKGTISGRSAQHSLWMAKVKTRWWFDELRKRAEYIADLKNVLLENEQEQRYV
jgi:hypothetical protein